VSKKTDYLASAPKKTQQEKIVSEHTKRVESTFVGDMLKGTSLVLLMALVPLFAFLGLAFWSLSAWDGKHNGVAWVFMVLAFVTPIFVFVRALKSKSEITIEFLTDMVSGFWLKTFPFIVIGALGILTLSTALGLSFQATLGLLVLLGVLLFLFLHMFEM